MWERDEKGWNVPDPRQFTERDQEPRSTTPEIDPSRPFGGHYTTDQERQELDARRPIMPAPAPVQTFDRQDPAAAQELPEPATKPGDVPLLGPLASLLSPDDPTRAPIVGLLAKAISDTTRPTSGQGLFAALGLSGDMLNQVGSNVSTDMSQYSNLAAGAAKELGAPQQVQNVVGPVGGAIATGVGALGGGTNAALNAIMGVGNDLRDAPMGIGTLYRALWEAPMNALNEATIPVAGGLIAGGNILGRGISDIAGLYGAKGGIEGLWAPKSRTQEYLQQLGQAAKKVANGKPLSVGDYLAGGYESGNSFEQIFATFVNPINVIDIYPIGYFQKARATARATGKAILPEAKAFGKTIVPRIEMRGENSPLIVRWMFDLPDVKANEAGAVPMYSADKLGIKKPTWWQRLMPTELEQNARGYEMLRRTLDNIDGRMIETNAEGLRDLLGNMVTSARTGELAKEFFGKYPGMAAKDAQTAIRLTGGFDVDSVWKQAVAQQELALKAIADNGPTKGLTAKWQWAVDSLRKNKTLDPAKVFDTVAKYELRDQWGKYVSGAIRDNLGITDRGVIKKMFDSLRAWEGALYIGLNPGTWIRNGWDNKKNLILYGINPRTDYNKIAETYKAVGWDPFSEIRAEIKKGIDPEGGDYATGAFGASVPRKIQELLPWFQRIEEADRKVAYWSGFDKARRINWRRGHWFRRMPKTLEDSLNAVSPRLSNLVYGAIEAGHSPQEIYANINNIANVVHVEAFLDDLDFQRELAQALGATGELNPDVMRLIMADHADGLNEAILKALGRTDVDRATALAQELGKYRESIVQHFSTLRKNEAPNLREAAQKAAQKNAPKTEQSDPAYDAALRKARAQGQPSTSAAPPPPEPPTPGASLPESQLDDADYLAYEDTRRTLESKGKYDGNEGIGKIEKMHPEWKRRYDQANDWKGTAAPSEGYEPTTSVEEWEQRARDAQAKPPATGGTVTLEEPPTQAAAEDNPYGLPSSDPTKRAAHEVDPSEIAVPERYRDRAYLNKFEVGDFVQNVYSGEIFEYVRKGKGRKMAQIRDRFGNVSDTNENANLHYVKVERPADWGTSTPAAAPVAPLTYSFDELKARFEEQTGQPYTGITTRDELANAFKMDLGELSEAEIVWWENNAAEMSLLLGELDRLNNMTPIKKKEPGVAEYRAQVQERINELEAERAAIAAQFAPQAEPSAAPAPNGSYSPTVENPATRFGEIGPDGAHFSEGGGGSTYFDPFSPDAKFYIYPDAKIADMSDPRTARAVVIGAKELPANTQNPAALAELDKVLDDIEDEVYPSYIEVENLGLAESAKAAGYDGIRFFENDDIDRPSTVNIWNLEKVQEVPRPASYALDAPEGQTNVSQQETTNVGPGVRGGESPVAPQPESIQPTGPERTEPTGTGLDTGTGTARPASQTQPVTGDAAPSTVDETAAQPDAPVSPTTAQGTAAADAAGIIVPEGYTRVSDDFFVLTAGKGFQKVDGSPIEVEGTKGIDLFIHRSFDKKDEWVISEGMTGMRVSEGPSREKAIQNLIARLNAIKPDSIIRGREMGLREYLSPRYLREGESSTLASVERAGGTVKAPPGSVFKNWETAHAWALGNDGDQSQELYNRIRTVFEHVRNKTMPNPKKGKETKLSGQLYKLADEMEKAHPEWKAAFNKQLLGDPEFEGGLHIGDRVEWKEGKRRGIITNKVELGWATALPSQTGPGFVQFGQAQFDESKVHVHFVDGLDIDVAAKDLRKIGDETPAATTVDTAPSTTATPNESFVMLDGVRVSGVKTTDLESTRIFLDGLNNKSLVPFDARIVSMRRARFENGAWGIQLTFDVKGEKGFSHTFPADVRPNDVIEHIRSIAGEVSSAAPAAKVLPERLQKWVDLAKAHPEWSYEDFLGKTKYKDNPYYSLRGLKSGGQPLDYDAIRADLNAAGYNDLREVWRKEVEPTFAKGPTAPTTAAAPTSEIEPWRMSRRDYQEWKATQSYAGGVPVLNARDGEEHERLVRQAFAEGKPVPQSVLDWYGLGRTSETPAPSAPTANVTPALQTPEAPTNLYDQFRTFFVNARGSETRGIGDTRTDIAIAEIAWSRIPAEQRAATFDALIEKLVETKGADEIARGGFNALVRSGAWQNLLTKGYSNAEISEILGTLSDFSKQLTELHQDIKAGRLTPAGVRSHADSLAQYAYSFETKNRPPGSEGAPSRIPESTPETPTAPENVVTQRQTPEAPTVDAATRRFLELKQAIADTAESGPPAYYLKTVLDWNEDWHKATGDTKRAGWAKISLVKKVFPNGVIPAGTRLSEATSDALDVYVIDDFIPKLREAQPQLAEKFARKVQGNAEHVWGKILNNDYDKYGADVAQKMFDRVRDGDRIIRALTGDARGLDLTGLKGYTDEEVSFGPERTETFAGSGTIPETQPAAEPLTGNVGAVDSGIGGDVADEGVSTGPSVTDGETGIPDGATADAAAADTGAAVPVGDAAPGTVDASGGINGKEGIEPSADDGGPGVAGQRRPDTGENERGGTQAADSPDSTGNTETIRGPGAAGDSGSDSVGTGGRGPRPPRTADSTPADGPERVSHSDAGLSDYVITDGDAIGAGGPKTKFKQNVRAIQLLKDLDASGRLATPAEQAELVKYVGWGGLAQKSFLDPNAEETVRQLLKDYGHDYTENWMKRRWDDDTDAWAKEKLQLLELLTPEEYAQARSSTLNAHYTSPVVIKAMWDAVRRFGWTGGKVIEPAVGVGHFFGLMPADLAKASTRLGIDKDGLSAKISKHLYQRAQILHGGFETFKMADGTYSLGISNVPFGDITITDPRYNNQRFVLQAIHDYFFAKTLDKTQPGGLVAFITSHFTMDKKDTRMRKFIAERADLVGMIRLPNNAFRGNAGTDVVTDIVFLRKRLPDAAPSGESFVELGEHNGFEINEYYQRHPEMLLGEWKAEGSMYGKKKGPDGEFIETEMTLVPFKDRDLEEQLAEAVERLPEGIYTRHTRPEMQTDTQAADEVRKIKSGRAKRLKIENGKAILEGGGELVDLKLGEKQLQKVRDFDTLRNQWRETTSTWRNPDTTEAQADAALKNLNKAYDNFVNKHGYLNSQANAPLLNKDDDFPNVRALERLVEGTKNEYEKMDALTRRTIFPPLTRTKAIETGQDALITVLNESGRVDLERMGSLVGKSADEIAKELQGVIYRNPEGGWETADQYLAGNIRQKLKVAEEAAKLDPTFEDNAAALRAIIPEDLPPSKIEVDLGAPWMGEDTLREFMADITGARVGVFDSVKYNPVDSSWTFPSYRGARFPNAANEAAYNVQGYSFFEAVEDAANHQNPIIYFPQAKDEKRVVNQPATAAARELLAKINKRFAQWVWEDDARIERLTRRYNDTFNSFVEQRFNGSHLTFPGMNPVWRDRMYPHQANGIWRALSSPGNTLLSHSVGSGKSLQIAGIAMEGKRLGIFNKPVILTEKKLVAQLGEQLREIYPGSKVLVASKSDFEGPKRRVFLARIANGDWDAVVMSHSQFNLMNVSPETYANYVKEEIARAVAFLTEQGEQMAYGKKQSRDPNIKKIQKYIENLEAKLDAYNKEAKKDINITFEEMGIDQVIVDESHNFKRLWFQTKMKNTRGVTPDGSERAFNLYIKLRHLNEKNNGRGIVFATGTPLSNTLAEIYTLQRFLAPNQLKELGIDNFDAWAHTFGKLGQYVEPSPDGTRLRVISSFRQFKNVRQLSQLFHQFGDVILTPDLIKANVLKNMPKLEGDSQIVVKVPPTPEFKEYQKYLLELMQDFEKDPKPEKRHIPLVVGTWGNSASVDMRLIKPGTPDNPNTKLNTAIRKVFEVWQETHEQGLTQLMFINVGIPGGAIPFDTYGHVKKSLVKMGIPADEIEFRLSNEKGGANALRESIAQVNRLKSGKTKVLIGSYASMGQGMNAQDRMIAVHHLDVPWRPDQIEQADGRIIRQGNMNPRVRIYRYVTETSTDMGRWTKVEQKSRMIHQFLKGDLDVNAMDDPGAVSPESAAEIAAAASGNPMLVERTVLAGELQSLEAQHIAYRDKVRNANWELARIPGYIKGHEESIAFADRVIAAMEPELHGKEFKILIGGKEFTEREAAGNEIIRIAQDYAKQESLGEDVMKKGQSIGLFRGMEMFVTADWHVSFGGKTKEITISPKIKFKYDGVWIGEAQGDGESGVGMISRLNNALGTPASDKRYALSRIQDYKQKQAVAQAIVDQPFEYAARLEEVRTRVDEIDAEMTRDLQKATDNIAADEEEAAAPEGVNLGGLTDETLDADALDALDEADDTIDDIDDADKPKPVGMPMRADLLKRLDKHRASMQKNGMTPEQMKADYENWLKEQFDMPAETGPNVADAAAENVRTLDALIPLIQKRVLDAAVKKPIVLDPLVAQTLAGYLQKEINPALADSIQAANAMGRWNMERTVLNYDDRRNFDHWMSYVFPFLYWRRAQMVNWALRFLEKPNLWNGYVMAQEELDRMTNSDEYPERLRGKLRWPLLFGEDWMGGSVYFNPLEPFIPVGSLYGAELDRAKYTNAGNAIAGLPASNEDVAKLLRRKAMRGLLSRNEVENAIANRSGELWEQARQEADSDVASPDNLTGLFTPHAPLQWLIAALTDNTDSIGPLLPLSRPIRNITGAMGMNEGMGINIESPVRDLLRTAGLKDLPEFDPFEEYRVLRELANLVQNKVIDEKTARQAMMEKSGKAWAMAAQRANQGKSNPTSQVIGAVAPTQIFPTGEQGIREAQEGLSALRNSEIRRLGGNPDAMTYDEEQQFLRSRGAWEKGQALPRYYDEHPEITARQAVFQENEERLKKWVVEGIWEKYGALSDLDKRMVRAQMDKEFQEKFLSAETRNYDDVELLDLIRWGQQFDVLVPNVPKGEIEALDIARADPAQVVRFVNPEMAQRYQSFVNTLDAQFDQEEMDRHGDEYRALDTKEEKSDYKKRFPEYAAYTKAWQTFYDDNEDIVAALKSVGAMSESNFQRDPKDAAFESVLNAMGWDYDIYNKEKEQYYAIPKGPQRTAYLQSKPNLLRAFTAGRIIYGDDDEQGTGSGSSGSKAPRKKYNEADYVRTARVKTRSYGQNGGGRGPSLTSVNYWKRVAESNQRYKQRQMPELPPMPGAPQQ